LDVIAKNLTVALSSALSESLEYQNNLAIAHKPLEPSETYLSTFSAARHCCDLRGSGGKLCGGGDSGEVQECRNDKQTWPCDFYIRRDCGCAPFPFVDVKGALGHVADTVALI
jgi:hypothetical protein